MENTDRAGFAEMMKGLCEYYRVDDLSRMAINIYFNGLQKYSLAQLEQAASEHACNTKSGQFFPKISDFVKYIDGHQELTVDQIIALARARKCPLGIMCAIKIGSFDLFENASSDAPFLRRQKAEECLLELPEWRLRAENGDYTDHEHTIMMKHRVDALRGFTVGSSKPEGIVAKKIHDERLRVSRTERHKFLTNQSESHPGIANKDYLALPPATGQETSKESLKAMIELMADEVKVSEGSELESIDSM